MPVPREATMKTPITSSTEPSGSPPPSLTLIGHRIYRLGSSTLAREATEETLRAEQEEGFQCCRHHLTSEHGHCR